MAKVDPSDASLYLNHASYGEIRAEIRKSSPAKKKRLSRFSSVLEAAGEAGIEPAGDLPVSDETTKALMERVRSAGADLRARPFQDEILRYKQAVRNFMRYVVDNGFSVFTSEGIPNYLRPAYSGERGTPVAQERRRYTSVQVIDRKLDDLAAALLAGQAGQIELAARLEEITGLLVDLLQ